MYFWWWELGKVGGVYAAPSEGGMDPQFVVLALMSQDILPGLTLIVRGPWDVVSQVHTAGGIGQVFVPGGVGQMYVPDDVAQVV